MTLDIKNFRDFRPVFMIEVYEGAGTVENPSRIAHYIYDQDGRYIGVIDPHHDERPTS